MNKLPTNKIIYGDCLEVMRGFPDESIDCLMTSPPYWKLRDYGLDPLIWGGDAECVHEWRDNIELIFDKRSPAEKSKKSGLGLCKDRTKSKPFIATSGIASQGAFCTKCNAWRGSLGLEPTIELYISHLCDIFDEVYRVLKKTGCCFVNIGDSYAGSDGMGSDVDNKAKKGMQIIKDYHRQNVKGVPAKSLYAIPERFVIEMMNRGWIRRNTIIWYKRNYMPSSAKDRFTVDFEYIYFFTKSSKYYFEQQLEKSIWAETDKRSQVPGGVRHKSGKYVNAGMGYERRCTAFTNGAYRNKRCVWDIPTQAYSGAHFAVFPPALVKTPILAGCPPDGIVLDPFAGSGTTAEVARKLGRNYIMIELSPEYVEMAEQRLAGVNLDLFVDVK